MRALSALRIANYQFKRQWRVKISCRNDTYN